MSKYIQRIAASKEEKTQAQLENDNAAAKLAVEGAINTAKAKSLKIQAAYDYVLSTVPFNVDMVLKAEQDKAENEKTLASLERILTENF